MSVTRLRIASQDLPIETHYRACSVSMTRLQSGRREVTITASGQYAPDVSGIDWTAGVSVAWIDLSTGDTWQSVTVLSTGIQVSADLAQLGVSWTLAGHEAPAGSVLVTIAGTAYLARMAVSPLGGIIQRRSNGAGALHRAWGKRAVSIHGESTTVPSVTSGTIAVSGPVYSGNILCRGVAAEADPQTGLYTWTVEGEEP